MEQYLTVWNVLHAGEVHPPGSLLEMEEADAEQLLAQGAIIVAPDKAAPKTKKGAAVPPN